MDLASGPWAQRDVGPSDGWLSKVWSLFESLLSYGTYNG